MDPLHFCIAIIPVSVYMFLIGWINLSRRPFLTGGARDLAALAIAVSGFVIAGPMELFLPESGAAVFGSWIWLPLILLYALVVTLFLLLTRPRLIIYNMTSDQLRPTLQELVSEMDSDARWAGNSVVIPNLGMQLAIEAYPGIRNVSLTSVGPEQDLDGWAELKVQLQNVLAEKPQPANSQGVSFVLLSIILAAAVVYSLVTGRQEISQGFLEMLRM